SSGDQEEGTVNLADALFRRSLRHLEQMRRQGREVQNLRDENALLRNKYTEVTQQTDALRPAAVATPPQAQELKLRRCLVEPPAKYDGGKEGFTTFKAQCELYIHLHQNDFTDEKTKVGFLINQLTGAAVPWSTAKLIAQDPILNNVTTFLNTLEQFLVMGSCKEMVIHEIKHLQQGAGSATDYTTKFQLLMNDLGWNEEALMVQYQEGLREEILDDLAHALMPETLQPLMLVTIHLDARLTERAQERWERRPGPMPAREKWFPRTAARPQPEPMQLGAARPRIPRGESDYHHPAGPCFVCGQMGHLARFCSLKKQVGNFQSQHR
uniref:CCHC-type domain-containing protein n=1 Tax=Varanus komodoensis TaxID=61221 RepID=A0A8D2IY41_VARKO